MIKSNKNNKFRLLPLLYMLVACVVVIKLVNFDFDSAKNAYLSIPDAQAQNEDSANNNNADAVDDQGVQAALEESNKNTLDAIGGVNFLGYENNIEDAPSEIRLLMELNKRRLQLDQQSQNLNERGALLNALEKRLKEQSIRLQKIKDDITVLLERYDESVLGEKERLRKIYSNMKPKQAAAILDELDLETLLLVITSLKPREASPIIGNMQPERARLLTIELAQAKAGKSYKAALENIGADNNDEELEQNN